jgi:hypothetical protein
MLLSLLLVLVLLILSARFILIISKKNLLNPLIIIFYIMVILLVNILTWALNGWDSVLTKKTPIMYYFEKKKSVKYQSSKHPQIVWESTPEIFFTTRFQLYYQHLTVYYTFIKNCIISVSLATAYFIYTTLFFKVQFLKQLAVWFIVGMLYFWLMSGFNFFLKRYKYGKFTSAIQRFWKRTNVYFWLIEGFLMLLFFYYYLNSSQEPSYMYDFSSLNQEYLISSQIVLTNVVFLSLVLYFIQFTLLRVNSNHINQINLYILIISIFIFNSFFVETYQFYYVLSTFSERVWNFNEEDNIWAIEIDTPTLRTKNQYLLVCLIAKYWHFLFIFLSWVFFVMKSFERQKVTYIHLSANLQNIIILYVLNLVCYAQWLKWAYRRFFDVPYTWFFTNPEQKFLSTIISEVYLTGKAAFEFNPLNQVILPIIYKNPALWQSSSLALWKFL